MTRQPGASNGAYGFEYCALHYYSETEGAFFLSSSFAVLGGRDERAEGELVGCVAPAPGGAFQLA